MYVLFFFIDFVGGYEFRSIIIHILVLVVYFSSLKIVRLLQGLPGWLIIFVIDFFHVILFCIDNMYTVWQAIFYSEGLTINSDLASVILAVPLSSTIIYIHGTLVLLSHPCEPVELYFNGKYPVHGFTEEYNFFSTSNNLISNVTCFLIG